LFTLEEYGGKMQFKLSAHTLSGLALILTTSVSQADIILSAQNAFSDGSATPHLTSNANPVLGIINQSGLLAHYTSGVDDFNTFVSGTTSTNGAEANGYWPNLGSTPTQLGNFYFDLGSAHTINALAIWDSFGSSALSTFQIYSSTDSNFSSVTNLGSYTIQGNYGSDIGQIFSFVQTNAQFFEIQVTSNWGYTSRTYINEVAFSSLSSVPLPSAVWLFGSALIGFIGFNRKKTM
jgi:hypothetical protein